jgi:hypothetical protein
MREAIKTALAILAASVILWAVEPARAEVQDSGKQMLAECASEADGYCLGYIHGLA